MKLYLADKDLVYGLHYIAVWRPVPRNPWRIEILGHGVITGKAFKDAQAACRYAQLHKREIFNLIEAAQATA